MKREILITADGSHTVAVPDMNVTYHSIHGAVQESNHVFIQAGLHHVLSQEQLSEVKLLEMGFGTGLNAFLTALEASRSGQKIRYISIENFPLSEEEAGKLNYGASPEERALLFALHAAPWNEPIRITDLFELVKIRGDLASVYTDARFHLIYYDAFAPSAQPELWTVDIFRKLYHWLLPGGILVTYCSKSDVRRAMIAAGFGVEKIPGPPRKREMLRAVRR